MKKWALLITLVSYLFSAGSGGVSSSWAFKAPQRVNKAIELLERGDNLLHGSPRWLRRGTKAGSNMGGLY